MSEGNLLVKRRGRDVSHGERDGVGGSSSLQEGGREGGHGELHEKRHGRKKKLVKEGDGEFEMPAGFSGGGSDIRKQHNFRSRKFIEKESSMCHQCQRNDKGRVVRCAKCKTKRFCIPCIENWYNSVSL
ncbi:hypothetical protein V8G54_029514 [Vigna mungo]|uniref:RING-type domain-containing protein n=1 Tax=Vigna mungo TaxID=3915 RepID=A0AAQ3RLW3_VIGMU